MIDSHCHLDHEPIINNLNDVIYRSKQIGIEKLLTICTSSRSFKNILKIIEFDKIIYGSFGVHPHESDNDQISKHEIINNIKNNKKIIGVGETGLDFFYNNSKKNSQIKSFYNHIEAAIELNVPLIVHSRSAENKTFEILNQFSNENLKILMHCFTDSKEFAMNLIDLNAYFSASGVITFKNSTELQNTFKEIPKERLLIETDSPFLTPEPYRGKKNEPSYLVHTLSKLAEIKSLNVNEIDKITTNNFNSLFF